MGGLIEWRKRSKNSMTTININKNLHERVKKYCSFNGLKIQNYVEKKLETEEIKEFEKQVKRILVK